MLFKALALFVAFIASLVFTPLIKKLAVKIGAVDKPAERKVHSGIIPSMGGLAIYLSFMIAMLLFVKITPQLTGILIGGTIITIVGIIDDIVDLPAKYKLLGQILATIVIIYFGVVVDKVSNPFFGGTINLYWLSIPITVLWIVGIVNAFNLIDGLDGLASGVSIIALTILAVTSMISGQHIITVTLCLAASTLGFLRYNYNPAQIFLGDTGSMFLGFNLAAFSILGLTKGAALVSVFTPVVLLGIPITDTLIAIIRRSLNKRPVYEADNGHLHHKLLALGLSQKQVVLLIYATSMLFGTIAILLSRINTMQALIIFIALAAIVVVAAGKIGLFTTHQKEIGSTNWVNHVEDKYSKGA